MVTKKTRLMSALMAIIMLVTLFTSIVLPASAVTSDYSMPEAPDNLTAYKNRASNPKATDYAITDAYDWLAIIADSNNQKKFEYHTGVPTTYETFSGITLWLTNDINFAGIEFDADGDKVYGRNETMVAYYGADTGRFKGTIQGQGFAFKNLKWDWETTTGGSNYRTVGLIANADGSVIRDLTLDSSCSFAINRTVTTNKTYAEAYMGLLIGVGYNNPTFINCHNEADVTVVKESNATLSIGVFGRCTTGLTLINCGNSGNITNNDGGRTTALGDWLYADSANTIYNCYNTGVLYTTSSGNGAGLFCTGSKNLTEMECDMGNNYLVKSADNMAKIQNGSRSPGTLEDYATILNDTPNAELAWILNKNNVTTNYGRSYFTIKDGEIATGTKATLTVKIVVTLEGTDDHVIYANAGQDIDIAHPDSTNKATYALVDSTLGTVTGTSLNLNTKAASAADLTVKVKTTDVPNTSALEEKLAEIAQYGVEYYMKADGTVLTQSIVDTIQAKVTNERYTSYTQVAADLATLNAYVLHHPDAEDLKTVKEIYGILSSGCLSNAEGASIKADAAEALALVEDADSAQAAKEANEALDAVIADFEAVDWVISKLVPYKFHENALFKNVKEWAISDEEDWREAVAQDKDFEGEKLTLTADIDMAADGDNSPVLPLRYGQDVSFAGTLDGDGHVFKNLHVEATPANHTYHVGLVSALTKNKGKVMNLGIESGEIKANWGVVNIDSGSNGFGLGGIVGQASGGTSIVKCWNAADVKVVPTDLIITDEIKASAEAKGTLDENGNCVLEDDISVGGIVGRGLSSSVIDGCFSIGTVTGLLHASGLNDWGQSTGTVYNSYDAATLIVDDEDGYGQAVRYKSDAATTPIVINTYAVGHRFSCVTATNKANTIDNSNLLPVVVASGELAYLLSEYAEDKGNGFTYYKVENGKTVHATEDDRTFRITLKDAEGNTLYAYANGGTQLTIGGDTIDVNGDAEIDVADAAHDHNEVLISNFFEGKNYVWSHQIRCDYATVIDGVTAYCSREDDEQVDCTTAFEYVEGSADETHAHQGRQYCTVCNEGRIRNHEASVVTSQVIKPAECLVAGKTTYTCNLCGDMYTLDQPAALEHEFIYIPNADHLTHKITCNRTNCTLDVDALCTPDTNGWTETVEPGEDNFGEKQATCGICHGTIIVQLPKLAVLKADVQLAADEKTADVIVSLKNNVAVKDLTLTVGYDQTAMSLDGVDAAAYGFSAVIDSNVNGTAVITLTADADVTDALKDIVKLSFKMVTEEGNLHIPNKGYEIDLSVEATNAAGEPVAYEKTIGEFTITQGFANIAGDFLRDGSLDTRDAMLLMRFYLNTLPAEYENVITEDAADLDTTYNNVDLGDGTNTGRINIYDVIHLLRILNGWG